MATFLIAHGAWSGGWSWKKMRAELEKRGHTVFTPTYTGLGERVHLARADLGLSDHIADIAGVIEAEELSDFILVGHSYGGMVATGVAGLVKVPIRALVYLDAFVPEPGESVFSFQPQAVREKLVEAARMKGDGWKMPPGPVPPDTAPEDAEWSDRHRAGQPLITFQEPLPEGDLPAGLKRVYIYCTRKDPGDVFLRFADRIKATRPGPIWRSPPATRPTSRRRRRSPTFSTRSQRADKRPGEAGSASPSVSRQNPTRSPPLSASIWRASAGVAISKPRSSTMRRIFFTCSALLAACLPGPI
jgi:pimeloyl-ACP methyl ester carboxylesterase